MKIAWLSSWPPRPCGIATYSEELITALRKAQNDIHVVCHPDGGRPREKNVYPVMNTEVPGWDEAVYDKVQKINPDIVHIQQWRLLKICSCIRESTFYCCLILL